MTAPAPLALFDLDGTLSNSAPGIIHSARTAIDALGMPMPELEQLRRFVGPPLQTGLAALGVAPERIADGIAAYRAEFEAGGMWDSAPFEGIPTQLQQLRDEGLTLAIATSKPERYARMIAERWGLDTLVDGVYGAPPDHIPSTKGTVIAHALEELAELVPGSLPERSQIVMVGDRHHDVDGAAEHGIACLGVGWGYAEPGELDGAAAVVPTVDDLAAHVLGHLGVVARGVRPASAR